MEKCESMSGSPAMKLQTEIERAFGHRQRPSKLIKSRFPVTPEQRDALWFTDRDWRAIGWQDWERHPDAFYVFAPEAFVYYLPSILIGIANAPEGQLLVADALIGVLNRSPEVYHWDAFITKRLLGLKPAEYEAMNAWVLSLSGLSDARDEGDLTRAYETVNLLASETARIRGFAIRRVSD